MAFQMIPPRLSSSPPPLDSLPPVACPGVDEDDEFDHFSSHNASFDITGLSDKLPPTPESSPTKFPGLRLGPAIERGLTEGLDGTLEDSISQDSGVDSSNHPHEFSPQPQGDGHPCSREDLSGGDVRVDKEFSDSEQNDMDDFGDFQGGGVSGTEISVAQESLDGLSGNTSHDRNDGQISSQLLAQESENSKCEEIEPPRDRTNCSPPPLDCIVGNTVEEDGFTSTFLSVNDEDADFGDFASYEATLDQSSDLNHPSDASLHPHDLQLDAKATMVESDHGSMASAGVQQVSCAEKPQDGSPEMEDVVCKEDRNERVEVECCSEGKQLGENFSSSPPKGAAITSEGICSSPPKGAAITSEGICSHPSEEGTEHSKADVTATTSGDVKESLIKNIELESITIVSGSSIGEARTGDRAGLENSSPLTSGTESAMVDSEGPVEGSDKMVEGSEQEMGPSSNADATEHFSGVYGSDDESDFGDFNQANDDEDDLDFADLRKQAESSDFVDFGDFSSGFAENNEGCVASVEGCDDQESDAFGDFTASAGNEDKTGFGDFGEFEGHAQEGGVDDGIPQDHDDDFGDFSTPKSSGELQGFTTGSRVEEAQFPPSEDGVSKTSLVLQKLESLVAKWIPRASTPPQEESCPLPLLHQAIESDAFVWRQLENLESSAALRLSWSSTQAHTYFLSSVNVDARNILFGQKWSSSVPLFAQTLSFSPLTPAKSTEGRGPGGSGGVGLAGATKELPPDTSTAAIIKHGHHKKEPVHDLSSSRRAERGSEEQIPPAKFDWTSSGLTNPLEGPGLEQEFLSEGGEKGSCGRAVKSPPTPSPLVQQILGGGMSKVSTPSTPLQSLAPEVRQVVTQLPDLSFMRSRVLMFPIRGEQ